MRTWYSGNADQLRHDRRAFPSVSVATLGRIVQRARHQLAYHRAADKHRLYVVNHGGRESIEDLRLDARVDEPKLSWIGCVLHAERDRREQRCVLFGRHDSRERADPSWHHRSPTSCAAASPAACMSGGREAEQFELLAGTQLPGNNGLETCARRPGASTSLHSGGARSSHSHARTTSKPLWRAAGARIHAR